MVALQQERRRFMRFQTELEADYWTGEAPAAGRARVLDVSRAGMRVTLAQPMLTGAPVEFTLQLPGDNVPIFASGDVAWASAKPGQGGVGIRFRQIKSPDLARMLDYAYARWLGA